MDLENAEEILQILERYTKQKSKTIPDELNGYLSHVAMTGDSVYTWPKVQFFFREKLAHVLKEFHDTTPRTEDVPISRNVDPFNYDTMKTTLLERFDLFNAAPFTIQRLSELLSDPKKHYCRLDKFMRALEKNILVVSTVEPGHRTMGSENGDSINGDPLDINMEMEKEPGGSSVSPMEEKVSVEAQPSAAQNKTEEDTSERCVEATADDGNANTNGHQSDELSDTIEGVKGEETLDKTDNTSASVETVTVDVEPAEPAVKVSSPEENTAVRHPIVEASPATPDIEQPKETVAGEVDDKVISEDQSSTTNLESNMAAVAVAVCDNEISVEKKTEKHLLDDRDDDDEECQPTAAKLVKVDESCTEPESDANQADIATIDKVPSDEALLPDNDQRPAEEEEPLSEAVLLEENNDTVDSVEAVLPIVDETSTSSEAAVVDEPTTVDKRIDDDANVAIPTDTEPSRLPDAVDDPNNDTTSTDTVLSTLASTNDLDVLEEVDEDALIKPIVDDVEQNLLDSPVALAEPDVEMIASTDSAEHMAVEDPVAPVLATTNSDSDMDATQHIPVADEQMDVLENNSMDQDL